MKGLLEQLRELREVRRDGYSVRRIWAWENIGRGGSSRHLLIVCSIRNDTREGEGLSAKCSKYKERGQFSNYRRFHWPG